MDYSRIWILEKLVRVAFSRAVFRICTGTYSFDTDMVPAFYAEYWSRSNPEPRFDDQKLKKNYSWKKIKFFLDQKLQFTYP